MGQEQVKLNRQKICETRKHKGIIIRNMTGQTIWYWYSHDAPCIIQEGSYKSFGLSLDPGSAGGKLNAANSSNHAYEYRAYTSGPNTMKFIEEDKYGGDHATILGPINKLFFTAAISIGDPSEGKGKFICRNVQMRGGIEVMLKDKKIWFKPNGWNRTDEFMLLTDYDECLPKSIQDVACV